MYTGEKENRTGPIRNKPTVSAKVKERTPFIRENRKLVIQKEFEAFIQENDHPCLAAHSVVSNNGLRIEQFGLLGSGESASAMAKALQIFAADTEATGAGFRSFVAVFREPVYLTELKFEQLLWRQLQLLHEKDDISWDPGVSNDPESPEFSFSFAGKGFFIIGLHPASSRKARRFSKPALVFNLHGQFEQLKQDGKFEKMRDLIRGRDEAFQGSINPMAEDFGLFSEARQYSGRKVDESWKCPFKNNQI